MNLKPKAPGLYVAYAVLGAEDELVAVAATRKAARWIASLASNGREPREDRATVRRVTIKVLDT